MKDIMEKIKTLENKQPNKNQKGKMAWCKVPPKQGESNTKIFENRTFKWCAACCKGKGLWTTGAGLHETKDHDPTKFSKNKKE